MRRNGGLIVVPQPGSPFFFCGKVNAVAYQKGWSDQFFHKYSYDGENRLTMVETSLDGFTWERDAKYEYYVHGPLSRTVLGTQQVQGLDYAYTLQGWLKGINSAGATDSFDIGGDGRVSASNRYVARDAVGFALNYYEGDYKPVGTGVNPFPGYSAYLNTEFRPLYNGNISSMVSTNRVFGNTVAYPDSATMLFNYKYDQLNRITGMDVYNKFNRHTNSYSALTKLEKFKERVSYDANGNILQYLRNGDGSTGHLRMDSLQYHYYAGTNRLRNVRDSVPANWYGANATDKIVDIDNQTDTDNYIYDSIGNLIHDKAEQITNINWNVYGKITGISRGAGIQVPASEISYTYDASGNRISKTVVKNGNKSVTWYVRDAQGNVMATYSGDAPAATALSGFALQESERYIYGSSRLGVVTHEQGVDNGNAGPAEVVDTGGVFVRGERVYELSNHLGNVLVTVSDKKRGVADPLLSSLISHFEPIMLSGTDYYPFGMPMRVGGGSKYKYGFNGKENDNEVKGGDGLQQDYGMRVYDLRLGRFLSVDPLAKSYPWYTPYQYAGNSPISFRDVDGGEPDPLSAVLIHWVASQTTKEKATAATTKKSALFAYGFVHAVASTVDYFGMTEDSKKAINIFRNSNMTSFPISFGTVCLTGNCELGIEEFMNADPFYHIAKRFESKLSSAWEGDYYDRGELAAEAVMLLMPIGEGMRGAKLVQEAAVSEMALAMLYEDLGVAVTKTNHAEYYLLRALRMEGIENGARIPLEYKKDWVEDGYKYVVRAHEGNATYTTEASIFRVQRQKLKPDGTAAGEGWEYLDTKGKWHKESTLKERSRTGVPNPNFNEEAARSTHIKTPEKIE